MIYPEESLLAHKFISVMGGVGVLIVLALVLLALGAWLRVRVIKLRQMENDRIAQRIMSEFQADPGVTAFELLLPRLFTYSIFDSRVQ